MKRLSMWIWIIILSAASTTQTGAQTKINFTNIVQNRVNLRDSTVVLGTVTVDVTEAGFILVQFNGKCVADVGDRIALAASDNTTYFPPNDGSVNFQVPGDSARSRSFSHTRRYAVTPGSKTFYALGFNAVNTQGSGIATVRATLTAKFFPEKLGRPFVRHVGISRTRVNVRDSIVVMGQIDLQAPLSGWAVVTFDGLCYSDYGDLIVVAAGKVPRWFSNDGNCSVKAVSNGNRNSPFSHTRVYQLSPGDHSFYAVAHNVVYQNGNGNASIYGSLTVEFFPTAADGIIVDHAEISETRINVRSTPVMFGSVTIDAPEPGRVWVHFDGLCVSTPGDRIVLAASNTGLWAPLDGNVTAEALDNFLVENSFSHTRVYEVPAGTHYFYAVVQNYHDLNGDGIASIYANLTAEFMPETSSTGVTIEPISPEDIVLEQNYPNPFNPNTTISYTLNKNSFVVVKIYNLLGREIKTLVNNVETRGQKQVVWDGKNSDGVTVPSGIYICRFKSDGSYRNIRMMLLK